MKTTTLTLLATLTMGLSLPATSAFAMQDPSPQLVESNYTDAELDSLLAPIALYPDSMLTHILIASTYPLEVVAADRWRQDNLHLSPEQVEQAIENFDWDPSVKALVAFEQVLHTMADDLNWLQAVGDNVLISQSRVLARVQVLRQHAMQQGSLNNNEYLNVERDRDVIVIEPRRQEIVYVPYYDTRVVYGNWWHPIAPVFWHHPINYRFSAGIYWSPSIRLSSFFYFGGIHWHDRYVVVNHRPVRSYYHGSSVKRVYTRDYQRWSHDSKHRRTRYSDRVVHTAPAKYRINSTRHIAERRQVDYRPNARHVSPGDHQSRYTEKKHYTPRATERGPKYRNDVPKASDRQHRDVQPYRGNDKPDYTDSRNAARDNGKPPKAVYRAPEQRSQQRAEKHDAPRASERGRAKGHEK